METTHTTAIELIGEILAAIALLFGIGGSAEEPPVVEDPPPVAQAQAPCESGPLIDPNGC